MARSWSLILVAGLTLTSVAPAHSSGGEPVRQAEPGHLFDRGNLVAWCIVPFDGRHRAPEDRAAMLASLGFRHFAYDWRAEHVPQWDAEVAALRGHGVALDAFWCPGELNEDSQRILNLLRKHGSHAELWVLLGLGDETTVDPVESARRVAVAADKLRPLAEAAGAIGSSLALYNHGGWFGEPEHQVAIIDALRGRGVTNVGMVYNLHHAQPQLGRLASTLKLTMPYLRAINLDGVDRVGEPGPRKILPLGQGAMDLAILRTIRDSGYRGPIGILGHTADDAEARLRDNLDGLDWLVPQLDGHPAGPRPTPRTPVPALAEAGPEAVAPGDLATVAQLLADARTHGDGARGAAIFASSRLACLSCHKVAGQGGSVGPDLSALGVCTPPDEVVRSILWPNLAVRAGYEAVTLALHDGTEAKGYEQGATDREYILADPTTAAVRHIPRDQVQERRAIGSLMPEGLLTPLSPADRRDLVRFLVDLGRPDSDGAAQVVRLVTAGTPAPFPHDRAPLRPDLRPLWTHPVNRDRDFDFYAKQAAHFARDPVAEHRPNLLPAYPGLDGGAQGHWGNQNESTWASGRWNQTDLGSVVAGVLRGDGVTVPRAVCVRLDAPGGLAVAFDPDTLNYPVAWTGGFVRFGNARHGFLDGILMAGTPTTCPEPIARNGPTTYHGFYRAGDQVVFAYRVGALEMLDAPTVRDGRFERLVGPRDSHPLRHLTEAGGPRRWLEVVATRGTLGPEADTPYTVDTIEPPFANSGRSLMFFGGLDFDRAGNAYLATMQGEVWRASGLTERLERVEWRRIASGLHQALGLVVDRLDGDALYVLGRDGITRLVDLNGDGEADFHEAVARGYRTSTAGHDFIAGLEREASGAFLTASGPQGVIRVRRGDGPAEVLATGFRNPDGLGLAPDGSILVPSSEGDWVPASSLSLIRPGGHYGFGGPRGHEPPDLPLVQLPRGIDNSAGAPVFVADGRMGPVSGHWVALSFGAGTAGLVLVDPGAGVPQGAYTPLPGEFPSGSHRGRVNPQDGRLYVAGMNGWGSYTPQDGSLSRIRPTGQPARLPVGFEVRSDGVLVTFSEPIDPSWAATPSNHLAQAWNYRYGPGYGSPEYSPRHPGVVGHDRWPVRAVQVLTDGRTLFVALPDLQPVNTLHLHLRIDAGPAVDLFATVHHLGAAFDPASPPKSLDPDPIVGDLALLDQKPEPNRWAKPIPGAREIVVEAGKNLSFSPRSLTARAGEPIRLVFRNPDVVPHNWALVRSGTLGQVGDLANRLIAQPDAARRGYIPASDAVLAHTDLTLPDTQSTIFFRAPTTPGRYPFLCTFPGHWMVMNGELIVQPAPN